MDGIVHILWIMMVTREQLSENRVFDRTRPEYKESAIIALSEGLITDFSDSLGGRKNQSSQLDRRTLVRSVSYPLPVSESSTSSSSASVSINGGNVHNSHELLNNVIIDHNSYKDGSGQQCFELSVVCQTRNNKILKREYTFFRGILNTRLFAFFLKRNLSTRAGYWLR